MKILVINGPNLNLLGRRPQAHYGDETLPELEQRLADEAARLGGELTAYQSNHEGELIDRIQASAGFDGIILNPGGYTHSSVAIRDAVETSPVPVIEVHLSNIHGREPFRRRSVIAGACRGQISGLGSESYVAALHVFARMNSQGK